MKKRVYVKFDPDVPGRIMETLTVREDIELPESLGWTLYVPAALDNVQLQKHGGASVYLNKKWGFTERHRVVLMASPNTRAWSDGGTISVSVRGLPAWFETVRLCIDDRDVVELTRGETLELDSDQPATSKIALADDEFRIIANPIYVRFTEPTE